VPTWVQLSCDQDKRAKYLYSIIRPKAVATEGFSAQSRLIFDPKAKAQINRITDVPYELDVPSGSINLLIGMQVLDSRIARQ